MAATSSLPHEVFGLIFEHFYESTKLEDRHYRHWHLGVTLFLVSLLPRIVAIGSSSLRMKLCLSEWIQEDDEDDIWMNHTEAYLQGSKARPFSMTLI